MKDFFDCLHTQHYYEQDFLTLITNAVYLKKCLIKSKIQKSDAGVIQKAQIHAEEKLQVTFSKMRQRTTQQLITWQNFMTIA